MKNFLLGVTTSLFAIFTASYFGLFTIVKVEPVEVMDFVETDLVNSEVVCDEPIEGIEKEVQDVTSCEVIGNNSKVTFMVPRDVEEYDRVMNDFLFGPGGQSPADDYEFVEKEVEVEISNYDLMHLAVSEATAVGLLGSGPERGVVKYLEVERGTAYVVLDIDEDGWSGSSIAIGKIQPLVERTLKRFDEVDEVVFGYSDRSRSRF